MVCLQAQLDADIRHDLPAITAAYDESPNVTINGQVLAGSSTIRLSHDRFGFGENGAFSEVAVKERPRHNCELAFILEQTLSGVHTGQWQRHKPTGRRFEIPVCTVYTLTNLVRLGREDVYFDSMLLHRQLGLSDAPESGLVLVRAVRGWLVVQFRTQWVDAHSV